MESNFFAVRPGVGAKQRIFHHIPTENKISCPRWVVNTFRPAITRRGSGRLVHDCNGFHLTGCNGELDYSQGPLTCYSVYSDYYWYEIGDMICIGNQDILYYCFPKNCGDVVAKTRLAVEELYKLKKRRPAAKGE